jgi:uncharacterized protein YidB (DUF937 family)
MELFDIAAKVFSGATMGADRPGGSDAQDVLGAVVGALNKHPGGLGGVVGSLSKGGLRDVVSSWIGNGPYPQVTSGQVQGALGSGDIAGEIARRLDISPDIAGTVLSKLLPHIIDHLTPDGHVPQSGLSGAGSELLESILGRAMGASR